MQNLLTLIEKKNPFKYLRKVKKYNKNLKTRVFLDWLLVLLIGIWPYLGLVILVNLFLALTIGLTICKIELIKRKTIISLSKLFL